MHLKDLPASVPVTDSLRPTNIIMFSLASLPDTGPPYVASFYVVFLSLFSLYSILSYDSPLKGE